MILQYAQVNVQEVCIFTILSTVKADYNEIQEQRRYKQTFNLTSIILCSPTNCKKVCSSRKSSLNYLEIGDHLS